jgi:hypothetical protein
MPSVSSLDKELRCSRTAQLHGFVSLVSWELEVARTCTSHRTLFRDPTTELLCILCYSQRQNIKSGTKQTVRGKVS